MCSKHLFIAMSLHLKSPSRPPEIVKKHVTFSGRFYNMHVYIVDTGLHCISITRHYIVLITTRFKLVSIVFKVMVCKLPKTTY